MSNYMILNVASAAAIEQQALMLKNVGVGFGVLAGALLALSVILFIKLDIKRVLGEKSGRVERKTIEQLEQETAMSGKLQVNRSGKKVKRGQTSEMKVQDIFTNLEKEVVHEPQDTGAESTAPLGNEPTGVLKVDAPPEEVYSNEGIEETSLLNSVVSIQGSAIDIPGSVEIYEQPEVPSGVGTFRITKNIVLIHTREYI